ncbi:hypothetical protein ABZP36_032153 [Zizania latifolia]
MVTVVTGPARRTPISRICLLRHASPGNLSSRQGERPPVKWRTPHAQLTPPRLVASLPLTDECPPRTAAPHLAALDAGAQWQPRRPLPPFLYSSSPSDLSSPALRCTALHYTLTLAMAPPLLLLLHAAESS